MISPYFLAKKQRRCHDGASLNKMIIVVNIIIINVICILGRFRIRPTLGQLCPRRMPPSIVNNDGGSQLQRNHRDITGQTGL